MSIRRLVDRVADLEKEVARLKAQLEGANKKPRDWLDRICGSFANDPLYEEAMRRGREWRESFRPKPKRYNKN